MNGYFIPSGTKGKILTRVCQDDYEIEDFTTRRDVNFAADACGINPNMYLINPGDYHPDSLGVELAKDGYAIFTNTAVFDREAKYILAVPFDKVIVQ